MMGWDGWTMGMGWGWVFGLVLLAGLVLLVVVVVRAVSSGVHRDPVPGPGRAKEVLAERYARGEIDTEEFRERLRTLEET